MTWTFLWLMLLLKIPIVGLLWLVWWAIHKADAEEPTATRDEDGGSKVTTRSHRLHPRPPRPVRPRRGPHAGAPPPAPRRTRSVVARVRKVEH